MEENSAHLQHEIKPKISNEELVHSFAVLAHTVAPELHPIANLETVLTQAGLRVATQNEIATDIFTNPALFCRSETFTRVLNLITQKEDISLDSAEKGANMCVMDLGKGFGIAMTEGFSGRDVANTLKTVITFRGNHLKTKELIPQESYLWEAKPNTAKVSLIGQGLITFADVAMVSFRFPIHLFPPSLLTEEEKDVLEEGGLKFIVRHYLTRKYKLEE